MFFVELSIGGSVRKDGVGESKACNSEYPNGDTFKSVFEGSGIEVDGTDIMTGLANLYALFEES